MKSLKAIMPALALGFAGQVHAATISFNGFADGQPVDQSYGDVAGVVDASYSYVSNSGIAPYLWSGGYSGGDGDELGALIAGFPNDRDTLRITVTGLNGTLFSGWRLAIGRREDPPQTIGTVRVFGSLGQTFEYVDSDQFGFLIAASGSFFDYGSSSSSDYDSSTIVFELTGDWNIGFQSISYTIRTSPPPPPPPPPPVPLPAAGGLLFAAGCALVLASRRRRAA